QPRRNFLSDELRLAHAAVSLQQVPKTSDPGARTCMVSAMNPRWLCLVLLVSIGACSSEKTSPEPPNPLATSDGFCHQFGVAACNDAVVTACSGQATATDSLRSACQLQQETFCNQSLPSGYSPAHAQACVDAVRA